MQTNHSLIPPKPITEAWRPQLVRLPKLTWGRRIFRAFIRGLTKFLVWLFIRVEIRGLENFPTKGPALIVMNHLGDADSVVMMASLPYATDAIGKVELYDLPVLGKVMDMYGVIWLHRGQADTRAIRAALAGFAEGRMIVIAPEGRESVTGSLEEGTNGAAFLAYKANVPIVPIALTGTDNANIYGHMKRLRRAHASLTVGKMFRLSEQAAGRSAAVREGTHQIMEALANLLPEEYRGVYATSREMLTSPEVD